MIANRCCYNERFMIIADDKACKRYFNS